ncbi:hypothetical protein OS190_05255 [Sulfitobacter sp. F26204]|uniref:hypothetical protein n=1 Tax=Sulfitobacter sp. F26204 TaxID=2996014 RepID=UPI00225DF012|nr:hypothetical protein [Sulfitobacter sp. F26204]MCX7558967.1 hypothetical protein [Sulfitobacter sp. F26204]
MTRLLWCLAATSLVVFAVLAYLSVFRLVAEGQMIFDSRMAGYSVEAGRMYLQALTSEQTVLYLGPFRVLDTVLPILLALTMALFTWHHAAGVSVPLRLMAALSPCVYLLLDLRENVFVALLLETGPQVSAGAILQASAYTVGKFISLMLALLLCVWAWRLVSVQRPDDGAAR